MRLCLRLLVGGMCAGLAMQAAPAIARGTASQQQALQWLQKVAVSAQETSYSGIFVYRNGLQSETSRVVHVAGNGRRVEKLEVLDGSPREVIRQNEEVRCYLPEIRLVIVEQRSSRRTFPALLPASLAGLEESYHIRKGARERIAGFDTQIVRIEPRDGLRYGHQFWVDQHSGLLLKADIFDAQGKSLESLAFTELQIGKPANPDAFKSALAGTAERAEGWQVRQASSQDMRDDAQWLFRSELPGFRRQAAMRRNIAHGDGETRETLHWVFSDGLAALSVFISPLDPKIAAMEAGTQTLGALSVVKRTIGGHQVVVMGDVPPKAVRHFADGIGVRGK